MKVLIGCEFSGVVREAFRSRGHDAWSCDLLPTGIPGQHYQGDVRDVLLDGWDLMVAHPPCTYLTNAGVRWEQICEIPRRWGICEITVEYGGGPRTTLPPTDLAPEKGAP